MAQEVTGMLTLHKADEKTRTDKCSSERRLDLLRLSAGHEWAFNENENEKIRVLEAHGNEIVRSIHINYQVSLFNEYC